MKNRRSEQRHEGDYVHIVNCWVLSMWDEIRDRSMKDQKLYLISKQEQRVGFHLLNAIEMSERLEEFVTCMMKLRATLKTSLLLLLELKAYPVNCSTYILHVVVRFCKAKLALDRVRFRENCMSTTEERSYWITFFWRDLDESATLLQVGNDLGIKSLIQVIHLVHEPACAAILRPQTTGVSLEERRLLLSSSSSWTCAKARPSEDQIVPTEYEVIENTTESPFRDQTQCLPGLKLADIASLVFGNLICQGPGNESVRNWELQESLEPVLTLVAQESGDENESKSQEHVMSLSELMRLESVVETVNDADNLQDVVSRLSNKFDACLVSESCSKFGSKHAQTHRLSKSWSYTAFSNQSPVNRRDTETSPRKKVCFQISPEVDDSTREQVVLPLEYSIPTMEDGNHASTTSTAQETDGPSPCKEDAKNTDEFFHYVSLGIKRGKKEKVLSGLKTAARILRIGNKRKNLWRTEGSKGTMSSPDVSQIALSHSFAH